jgi:hypothetical protein
MAYTTGHFTIRPIIDDSSAILRGRASLSRRVNKRLEGALPKILYPTFYPLLEKFRHIESASQIKRFSRFT